MTKEELEKTYPAVELAYPLAVASYDVSLQRLDGMDGRLQPQPCQLWRRTGEYTFDHRGSMPH
jgi:hypothetical protein